MLQIKYNTNKHITKLKLILIYRNTFHHVIPIITCFLFNKDWYIIFEIYIEIAKLKTNRHQILIFQLQKQLLLSGLSLKSFWICENIKKTNFLLC